MADYDNDGDVDMFVAGVYRNILFENLGDGTFKEVTTQASRAISGRLRQGGLTTTMTGCSTCSWSIVWNGL